LRTDWDKCNDVEDEWAEDMAIDAAREWPLFSYAAVGEFGEDAAFPLIFVLAPGDCVIARLELSAPPELFRLIFLDREILDDLRDSEWIEAADFEFVGGIKSSSGMEIGPENVSVIGRRG
jgi:hypothetical protein